MPGRILVVDDLPANVALLEAVLVPEGYEVVSADTGEKGLDAIAEHDPDLLLLDLDLPGIDGLEVCRRIREDAATAMLPVVIITATTGAKRVNVLETGADDFVPKPFDRAELLARVRSLVRIKRYQDEIAEMNAGLQDKVDAQLQEIERLGRLQRFLSPTVAEAVAADDASILDVHRREITVLFSDIRNFTAFTQTVEPEEATDVLRVLHAASGELVRKYAATVGNFTGDGLMVFFNDPVPREDAAVVATQMAIEARDLIEESLFGEWKARGYEIGFGQGLATGYATLGEMGFEGRYDYTVIGTVVNLAKRLCDQASDGEILLCDRTFSMVNEAVETESVGALELKGLARQVPTWRVSRPA